MSQVTILSKTPVLVSHTLLLPGETHNVPDGALRIAIAHYGADAFRVTGAPPTSGDDVPTGDDLTTIKGIGPAMRDHLAAQGIHTFAELAAANPDKLAAAIQGSEKQVEAWCKEAQELVKGDGS